MKVPVIDLKGTMLAVAVDLAMGARFQQGIPSEQNTNNTLDRCVEGLWRHGFDGSWRCIACIGFVPYLLDMSEGMKLLDQYVITTRYDARRQTGWEAYIWSPTQHDLTEQDAMAAPMFGSTRLEAGLRCIVKSCFGDTVDIPDYVAAVVQGIR